MNIINFCSTRDQQTASNLATKLPVIFLRVSRSSLSSSTSHFLLYFTHAHQTVTLTLIIFLPLKSQTLMASPQPLIDSLTSHIALFHSHSHQSPNPNPNPRSPILRWFSSLPLPSRQSILTFTDPALVEILLQMRAHLTSRGPTLFFLLPDLPSGPAALPSLCSRSARGLLAREIAKFELANSLLLFGSTDEDVLDSVTVSVDLVGTVDGFVEVMNGLSNGMFLRGEEVGLGEEWKELRWLKDKGYYSLDEFVANRLEVALRRSWGGSGAGKKGKGKVKGSVAAGESMFWRKKGCVDWWAGLDPGLRREFCCGFLGKAVKSLVIAKKNSSFLLL